VTMERQYEQYEEYKDSGIEWIGEIPNGWNTSKLKYFLAKNESGTWGEDPEQHEETCNVLRSTEITESGKWSIESPAERYVGKHEITKYAIEEGDLLVVKSSGSLSHLGKTALADRLVAKAEYLYSNFLQRLKVANFSPNVLYYMFNNIIVKTQFSYLSTTTTGLNNLSAKIFSNLIVPIASRTEQEKIATFLDKKTAEIDEIINKKEQLINHLEKYKKSVITEAVTEGKLGDKYINEDGELVDEIEMKDSGIGWIGEIPKYWKIKRLKFLVDTISQKWDGVSKYEYIGLENIRSDGGYLKNTQSSDNISSALKFKKDDVLYNTLRPYLRKCIVADFNGICTSEIMVLRSNDISSSLLSYIMLSDKFTELVNSSTYGAKMPRASWDFIGNIVMPFSCKKVQREIECYLLKIDESINKLIQKTEQSIEKYKEYKNSLIFEAVTGKIDLRDYEIEGGKEDVKHNNSREA